MVLPGGGIDAVDQQWKRTRYQYLFNAFALASVFRTKFLGIINKAGLRPPDKLPAKWVVDCTKPRHVARGGSGHAGHAP